MLYENTCAKELLNILKILQKDDMFKNYLLVGGTSLSLQLGHRTSIDIDLFTLDKQDNNIIKEKINNLFNNVEIINDDENILQILIDGIKVDFVGAKGKLMEKPVITDDLKLCHYKDIAGMKLNVISGDTGRKKAKDYVDIAYLINKLTLPVMFDIYKYKYDKTNILNVKKDLLDVSYINPYTWKDVKMISNDILLSDVPNYIKKSVENYNKMFKTKNRCILDIFKTKKMQHIKYNQFRGKDFPSLITREEADIKLIDDYSNNKLNGKEGSVRKYSYKDNNNKIQYVLQRISKDNLPEYICDIWHFDNNFNENNAVNFINQFDKLYNNTKNK
jgi:hypothetical protein